jgi:hypothetical protein
MRHISMSKHHVPNVLGWTVDATQGSGKDMNDSIDGTYRRQMNAMSIVQRSERLDPKPLPGARRGWIGLPLLENWQRRLLNKYQILVTDSLLVAVSLSCRQLRVERVFSHQERLRSRLYLSMCSEKP